MRKFALLLPLFCGFCASAQEIPAPVATVAPAIEEPAVPDDGVRVSILGYHDLAENLPETAMRIHTSKFRKQMETIRQMGIKVITLDEFTAWKKGSAKIPENSLLITFDDGWKSVYTDAYPILKEFGFPFTIFLYKNYVDGGGKALTLPMINEMAAHGATIGSHSVSHPYPLTVKSYRKKGPDAFDAYLRKEIGESKRFLESKFPVKVTTYAYPGGFFTEEMPKLGEEFGYDFMFTVLPGKIKRSLPNDKLPRYIVLGNYDKIFEIATTFREAPTATAPGSGGGLPGIVQTTPFPVTPEAGSIINSRLPEISADLSSLDNFDPATLSMKVSGFGEVPAIFSTESKKFSWQVNRRLRQASCQVVVTWKDMTGKAPETPLRWSFQIDRESAYLPDGE
ncbi:polysaccharide deacetylase family protein [bacterium]|nr:polysaccharide deacetylase family protein [bacterium]